MIQRLILALLLFSGTASAQYIGSYAPGDSVPFFAHAHDASTGECDGTETVSWSVFPVSDNSTIIDNGTMSVFGEGTLCDMFEAAIALGEDYPPGAYVIEIAGGSKGSHQRFQVLAPVDVGAVFGDTSGIQNILGLRTIQKGVALSHFPVYLTDSDGLPASGLTDIICQYSLDGSPLLSIEDTTENEMGFGLYTLSLLAAETNGDLAAYRCTSSTAGGAPYVNFITTQR